MSPTFVYFSYFTLLGFFVCLLETVSLYVAQAGLELAYTAQAGLQLMVTLLSQPPKRWDKGVHTMASLYILLRDGDLLNHPGRTQTCDPPDSASL